MKIFRDDDLANNEQNLYFPGNLFIICCAILFPYLDTRLIFVFVQDANIRELHHEIMRYC